jgi:hypothetical protein
MTSDMIAQALGLRDKSVSRGPFLIYAKHAGRTPFDSA